MDGIILLTLFAIFITYTIIMGLKGEKFDKEDEEEPKEIKEIAIWKSKWRSQSFLLQCQSKYIKYGKFANGVS